MYIKALYSMLGHACNPIYHALCMLEQENQQTIFIVKVDNMCQGLLTCSMIIFDSPWNKTFLLV
jgi:hypothetical protein